jgi:two-component system, OmpR family, response regulator CpxR
VGELFLAKLVSKEEMEGEKGGMDNILIIDDDVELCDLLRDYLQMEGFTVEAAHTWRQGTERALSGEVSLVILDVMLPEQNGFEILRRIREKSKIPVLMLTARGDAVDKIVGLELGADDYLGKPFNPRELVARLRAIKRRTDDLREGSDPMSTSQNLVVGDISLHLGTREVVKDGMRIELTGAEFALLKALLTMAGQVVSREELAQQALGRNLATFDRSIDVHIASLRKKLGRGASGRERIISVRGIGYTYTSLIAAIPQD